MSFLAMAWAAKQKFESSSDKFVLLIMANFANEDNEAYPSAAALAEYTCLNIKTVRKSLASLEELGFLTDTGERRGKTKQIVVFKINLKEDERVPNFTDKVPKSSSKDTQIRVTDTIKDTISDTNINTETTFLTEDQEFWQNNLSLLAGLGIDQKKSRSLLGGFLKRVGGDKQKVSRAIKSAVDNNARDPIPYISAVLSDRQSAADLAKQKEIDNVFTILQRRIETKNREWEAVISGGGGSEDHGLLQPEAHEQSEPFHPDGGRGPIKLQPKRSPATGGSSPRGDRKNEIPPFDF